MSAPPTSNHRNPVPARSRPRRTASTALPFRVILARPASGTPATFVHPAAARARARPACTCMPSRSPALAHWHRPVEPARKHAHPFPSRRLAHRDPLARPTLVRPSPSRDLVHVGTHGVLPTPPCWRTNVHNPRPSHAASPRSF